MTKTNFLENVEITTHAECSGIIDSNGECHIWEEFGLYNGQEVTLQYYLSDDEIQGQLDDLNWEDLLIGAFYTDTEEQIIL